MAIPLQYQSQFIPTDFGAVGQLTNLYSRDMANRDQLFDQSQAMRDQAIANVYGIETLDPDVFQQAGDVLSQKIDELVSKRGGDYGAAAKDISKLIAQESRNPIYGLNKRKLEQVSQLEQALARNPNLLALQDPRQIALTQKGLTPEDIAYSVADPADIQKAIKDIYGERGNLVRQTDLRPSGTKGYLESVITKGLTDREVQDLMQDPSTRETLLARIPQLQNYIDNPEVANWFTNQMQQGLVGLKGGQQKQFVRDYLDTTTGGTLPSWLSGVNMPQVGIDDVRLEKNNKTLIRESEDLTKLASNLNKEITNEDVSIDKVYPELIAETQTKYNIDNAQLNSFMKQYPSLNKAEALNAILGQQRIYVPELSQKVNKEAVINKRNKDLMEAKEKYSNYYSEGMSDEDFLNTVSRELTNRAKKTDKLFSMNVKGYDSLARINLRSEEQFTRKGSNKQFSLNEIYKQYKDKGATELYSESAPMFDDNLNIVVQGYDNELYEMKPSTDIHKYYADRLKGLKGLISDTNITPEEMSDYRDIQIVLPGVNAQISFDFNKPSGKPLQKFVNLTYPDKTSVSGVNTVQMPLDYFVNNIYKNIAQNAIFAQQQTPNE